MCVIYRNYTGGKYLKFKKKLVFQLHKFKYNLHKHSI